MLDKRIAVDIDAVLERFHSRAATIGVIGLGYVGLPLVRAVGGAGFNVIGFDIDRNKIDTLLTGETYIRHLADCTFRELLASNRFRPTSDFALIRLCDAVLICVPTPLTKQREPDLRFVTQTAAAIEPQMKLGQLIVLESTSYPGTTSEVVKPILERGGRTCGTDFFLAYSPEREDPGNDTFATHTIPKVIGGEGPDALHLTEALYSQFVPRVVPVSSTGTAEAVKITENIFRAVNIALVNELKGIYGAMGIDVWEVIAAAATKPFGFMPFYPGPGLGGHCIPIDPFYLTWKAREYALPTRFIELAGEINAAMPRQVVMQLAEELNRRFAKGLRGAQVLVLGIAYKKNVDDMRESPSLRLIELLEHRGARVEFHDPLIPVIPKTREHGEFAGRQSVSIAPGRIKNYDVVLIATDHDGIDYKMIGAHAKFVVDTRNAMECHGAFGPNVAKI